MDSSGSQSPFDFRNQIAFVQDVVKWFQIGTEHVLVSVITFSLDVIEEFPLNKYTKKETLIKAIGSVTYHGLLTKNVWCFKVRQTEQLFVEKWRKTPGR